MPDDKLFDGDALDNGADKDDGDSGLGNLPPLSDFDSQSADDKNDALPPLGDFEAQETDTGVGGAYPDMEPDSGFSPETPASKDYGEDAPQEEDGDEGLPAFDAGAFDAPAVSAEDDDEQAFSAGGFQDLAADSDFSPETPDIGPGPSTTLDTPIFDSAFGGDDSDFGGMDVGFGNEQEAPAASQEAPMFDDFGGGAETPAPDFSPDTGFGGDDALVGAGAGGGGGGALPTMGGGKTPSSSQPAPKKGGVSPLVVIVFGLIALIIGVVTSPFLSEYLGFLPNPLQAELEQRDQNIARLNSQIQSLQRIAEPGAEVVDVSEERLAELIREIEARTGELDNISGQLASTRATLDQQQRALGDVEREWRERNDEVIAAREFLEELRNETAIVQARQRGLIAEVDRLTGHVGELEEANRRRAATKDTLGHNIDRLLIHVKESIPLTPDKYDYAQRLARVKQLRDQVEQASWVTPELQNEYTSLYLHELDLARADEYFFARVTVADRFGHHEPKWAECLMRGNRAVYYRTLDGANIGSFENIGAPETPRWGFNEGMSDDVKSAIEATIVNARVPDFESQVQLLAERELAGQEGTVWQRTYSSL